jgi:hypothetical protein
VVVVLVVVVTITMIVTNADDHDNLIWEGKSRTLIQLFLGSCTSLYMEKRGLTPLRNVAAIRYFSEFR